MTPSRSARVPGAPTPHPLAWKLCICMSDTCADHRPSALVAAQAQPERHSTRTAPMPS